MPTIFRFRSLRVVIYTDDHWPPHVHVVGRGNEAKIALGGEGERASLIANKGFSRSLVAVALMEITEKRDLLMRRWREIHGDA